MRRTGSPLTAATIARHRLPPHARVLSFAAALYVSGALAGCGDGDDSNVDAAGVALSVVPGLEATHVQAGVEVLHARLSEQAQALQTLQAENEALRADRDALLSRLDDVEAALTGGTPVDLRVRYGAQEGLSLQAALDASFAAEQSLAEALDQAVAEQEGMQADLASWATASAGLSDELDTLAEQVDVAITGPRPCPEGLAPIGPHTCMDIESRGPTSFFNSALEGCSNAGLQLCDMPAVYDVCFKGPAAFDLSGPSFAEVPHWTSAAGRLPTGTPDENHRLAGLVLRRTGSECIHAYLHAGGGATGPDSPQSTSFAYRCCTRR